MSIETSAHIKKSFNFACFIYENIITHIPTHISINRKINDKMILILQRKFSLQRHLIGNRESNKHDNNMTKTIKVDKRFFFCYIKLKIAN